MASKREARDIGQDTGHAIGQENFVDLFNEYEGDVQVGSEGEFLDWFVGEVGSVESEHFRQFSPFEFTAADFNRSRDPDAVWEAYDEGVAAGARKAGREGLAGCVKVYKLP